MKVIWLASYPKSGNTWLRFFLYAYLYGEPESSNDLDLHIPDIHALEMIESLPNFGERVLCKTHLMMGPHHPYMAETAGFIHILRHPKDVLLSNLNYAKIGFEDLDERLFAKEFITHMGVPRWENFGMGNWPSHTASWLRMAPRVPHLFLRYERMKADPEDIFIKVVRFLDLPLDQKKVAVAVEQSSFNRLKAMEENERREGIDSRIFYTGFAAKARFMSQGASGQRLSALGDGLDEAFDARFEEVLVTLGYNVQAS